jgi:phage-related protein
VKAFKGNGERLVQSHAEGINNNSSLFLLVKHGNTKGHKLFCNFLSEEGEFGGRRGL